MIRAIVRNGLLHPLDPLPEEWVEGMEIEIEGRVVSPLDLEEIEWRWARIEALAAEIYDGEEDDPDDWKRVQEVIADQRGADMAMIVTRCASDRDGPDAAHHG